MHQESAQLSGLSGRGASGAMKYRSQLVRGATKGRSEPQNGGIDRASGHREKSAARSCEELARSWHLQSWHLQSWYLHGEMMAASVEKL